MARVAIAIVSMETRDDVLACLESLQAEPDVEIVVLDNASTDGTVAAIRERFGDVRVIDQPFRAGFGANNNTLIRATTAPYVYLLNPDTVSEEGSVRRLADVLERERRAAAVGPRVVFGDGRVQDTAWRFPSPLTCVRAAVTLGRGGITQSGSATPRRVDWAMACALMVRRSALDEVGLFDEGFFMYSEETDLERRLADAGWEVRFTPAVTVVHHQGRSSAAVPERRVNEQWRGRQRYWLKHHSALGRRVAATALSLQYSALAAIGSVLLRVPERLRPVPVAASDPATWRLSARNAFTGVRGPGLEELAAEFNSRRDAAAPDASGA
jgi:N-acetylglucosaminyl-diphospho-decaprenol L-rhamnosyltransferase